ncbi:MAG: FHA domain-containing protein [Candidatus Saganbacteria bacterium]|nr:FHA domain-containing protein [Candidatus Saganbacteria bacterium]
MNDLSLHGLWAALRRGLGRAAHTYKGPDPAIYTSRKQCLTAFDMFYKRAIPIQPGTRILREEGNGEKAVKVSVAELEAHPLLLEMGLERNSYHLGLYIADKGGRKVVVVSNSSGARIKDMPGPDLYVIEPGKYLSVGRGRDSDLKTDPAINAVSGHHLTVIFHEDSENVYIVDSSRNGTVPVPLTPETPYRQEHPDQVPLKITPSML